MTPPQTASILDGITRKSVITVLRDNGVEVEERDIARSELYGADEIFMCGTAAEVVPVREVDEHSISDPGPITLLAQKGYEDAIHGREPRYADWLDPVGDPDRSNRPDTVES